MSGLTALNENRATFAERRYRTRSGSDRVTRSLPRAVLYPLFLVFVFQGCANRISSEIGSSSSPTAISSSAQVVKLSTSPPVSIRVNGSADATVTLSITPGYHINANPATFPYLIATQLQAADGDGISTGKPVYPAAAKKRFEFAPEALAVYERETVIKLPLRAENSATKGDHSLPLKVRVQACDNEKCYPPATIEGSISIHID
jgi:hypothetical protein